jgi:hypothetical protein
MAILHNYATASTSICGEVFSSSLIAVSAAHWSSYPFPKKDSTREGLVRKISQIRYVFLLEPTRLGRKSCVKETLGRKVQNMEEFQVLQGTRCGE